MCVSLLLEFRLRSQPFTKISETARFQTPHLLRPKWNSGSFGRVDHAIRKAERNVTKVNSPTHHPKNNFGPFNSSMWSFSQTSTNFWMFAIQRTVQLAFLNFDSSISLSTNLTLKVGKVQLWLVNLPPPNVTP